MTNLNQPIANDNAIQFQREFLDRAGGNAEMLRQLAEALPEVFFSIVDESNRIVAFNRASCADCNLSDEYEAVGRQLGDLFPPSSANEAIAIYREVRESGTPVVNRVTFHGADRSIPRIANVFPVYSHAGTIIGTACFYRPHLIDGTKPDWYNAIKRAALFMETHFNEKITLPRLAAICELPVDMFRRAFVLAFEKRAGEYLMNIRLNHARKLLLTTNLTLDAIAFECGFYDQSHFVRAFEKAEKDPPARFRRKHSSPKQRKQPPANLPPTTETAGS